MDASALDKCIDLFTNSMLDLLMPSTLAKSTKGAIVDHRRDTMVICIWVPCHHRACMWKRTCVHNLALPHAYIRAAKATKRVKGHQPGEESLDECQ
jgi:hypothetical protein